MAFHRVTEQSADARVAAMGRCCKSDAKGDTGVASGAKHGIAVIVGFLSGLKPLLRLAVWPRHQRIERGTTSRLAPRSKTYTVAGGMFHQVRLARRANRPSSDSTSLRTGEVGP